MKRALMILIGSAAACGASAQPEGDILRIYDVRDLGAYSQGGIYTITPTIETNNGLMSLHLQTTSDGQTQESPDILMEVAGLTGLHAKRLQQGIYAATGPSDSHEQLMAALSQYRTIAGESYVIELSAYESTEQPMPGEAADGLSGPVFHCRQTVAARSSAAVQATSTEEYVSGWLPVVGNSAVGYQVQVSSAESGLTGTLVIGAGEAPEGRVNVQLAGWAIKSDVQRSTVTLGGDELPFATAKRQDRGIQTAIAAPIGTQVVLTTVTGFEPGESIVITAKVTRASE